LVKPVSNRKLTRDISRDTKSKSQSNSKGLKMLLVEDNPDDETLTLEVFGTYGLQNDITVVRDGQEALDYLFFEGTYSERIPRTIPDIIMLDLKIPKVSGLEVIKRVRKHYPTEIIPIVIFSSSLEEKDLISGYQAGANSYLRKPVNFKEFKAAINQFVLYWLLWNETPLQKKEHL
jgi:two-component system response regulator